MAVQIDLPDGTSVTAHNAAEESTLRQIASLLAQASGEKIDTSSLRAVGQNSKVASRSLLGLSGTIGQASDAAGNAARSFQNASTSFVRSTKSIFASFGKLGSAGSSFADSIEGLASPISQLAGSLPLIGGVASAAISGITAILTETAGNYQKMQQSGASFGYSMLETREIANRAGLSLGMLSNVVSKAREDMALFGGTTSQGGRLFAKLNKEVQAGDLGGDLLRMGIGFEEQSEMLAEVMGDFVRAGVDVRNLGENSEVVTRRLATMAIQQKQLAQFNGITLEQQREQIKMQKNNVQLQVSLAGMAPEQRSAAEKLAAQYKTLGPVAEQFFTEVMVHGRAVNENTAIWESQFSGLANKAQEWKAGIEAGTIGEKDVMNLWSSVDPEQLQKSLAGAGDIIKAAMAANIPGAEGLASTYVAIRNWGEKIETGVADAISKDTKEMGKAPDETTQLMTSTMLLAKQMQESLSTLATAALKSDLMTSVQKSISTFNTDVAELAKHFTRLDGTQSEAKLGELAANGNALAQAFIDLIPVVRDVISILEFLGLSGPAVPAQISAAGTGGLGRQLPPVLKAGGPINAGERTVVGELGPELITPSQSGFVNPNNKFAGMIQKSMRDAMKKYGQPTSASSLPGADMQKMLMDLRDAKLAAKPETNTQQMLPQFPEFQRGAAGGDDAGRKREVEGAMLSLPGLLMENINAITKLRNVTAELPRDLQAVLA